MQNLSTSVIASIRIAFHSRNRLAAAIGSVLGGIVPIATYLVAHTISTVTLESLATAAPYLVLGGLLFSAKTVYAWTRSAFQNAAKALGFCVLLEGVMVTSEIPYLPLVCLAILVGVNAVATACTLAIESRPAKRERAAKSTRSARITQIGRKAA